MNSDDIQGLRAEISRLALQQQLMLEVLSTAFGESSIQKRALMVILRELGGKSGLPRKLDLALDGLVSMALWESENEFYLDGLLATAERLGAICRLGASEAAPASNQNREIDTR